MLHILVELVHIDVHEELRGEVAKRQTDSFSARVEAADNLRNEVEGACVGNAARHYPQKDALVYGREEFPYVALSEKLDKAGRMLGGWMGQHKKQNSPAKAGEK